MRKSRIFVCISDVWPAVDHSTAQRWRSVQSHLHSGTNQPAQRVNICTERLSVDTFYGLHVCFADRRSTALLCFFLRIRTTLSLRGCGRTDRRIEKQHIRRDERCFLAVVHIFLELNKWKFEDVTFTYFFLCKKKKKTPFDIRTSEVQFWEFHPTTVTSYQTAQLGLRNCDMLIPKNTHDLKH